MNKSVLERQRGKAPMDKIATKLHILFVFALLLAGYAQAQPRLGEKAKDFTLENLKGEKVSLKDFQGKKNVFLNFFTTWCPYCREEVPILNKLYPEYKDKNVEFIGIDVRESKKKVSTFAEKYKIAYPILLDPKGEVGNLYRVPYSPFNLIIDQNGVIKFVGGFLSEKDLKKELDKIILGKKRYK